MGRGGNEVERVLWWVLRSYSREQGSMWSKCSVFLCKMCEEQINQQTERQPVLRKRKDLPHTFPEHQVGHSDRSPRFFMQWLDDLAIPGPRNHKHVSHEASALVSTVAVVHSSSE